MGKRWTLKRRPKHQRTDYGATHMPTEDEIAELAAEIRAGWDKARWAKEGDGTVPVELEPISPFYGRLNLPQ